MKKQFFYAAMAVVLMASCTSEDNLSVDPIIPDDDDKVAIQLGIDAPTVNATVGRAVGSVGDVKPEQGQENKNVWNGQQLYITMVDKKGDVVMNGGNPVLGYNNYNYFAPRGEGATADGLNENTNSGDIRIYAGDNNPATGGNGQGTLSYVYYPVSGQYDFYGYHVDDAKNVDNTDPTQITGITITGQQDIMGARTKEFTAANYFDGDATKYAELVGWDFSARTARSGIKPILKFEHQLARLKFFVKAGSDKTAEYKYDGSKWVQNIAKGTGEGTNVEAVPTAMKVKSIKAKNMVNKIDMNLNDNGKIVTGISGADASYATDGFSLLSREANGTMKETLDAVAPLVYDGTGQADDASVVVPANNQTQTPAITYADYKDGTQVGESIMFFPYDGGEGKNTKQTVELEMELAQWVQNTDLEGDNTYNSAEWGEKTQTATLKIHASSVKNATGGLVEAFEPGKSYNVYITVYGFEKIEITAELTAWVDGGDVNVDVEEGESRHNVDVTFNVQNENSEAISNAVITATYSYKNNAGETITNQPATFTAGDEAGSWVATVPSFAVLDYTITANGYETATGYANAKNGNEVTITLKPTGTAPAPVTGKTVTFTIPEGATLSWSYGENVTGNSTTIDNVPAETVITYSVTKQYFTSVEETYTVLADGENTINVSLDYATVSKTFIITGCTEAATITVGEGEPVTYAGNDGEGTPVEITPTAETVTIVISTATKLETITMSLEDLHNGNAYTIAYSELDARG